MVALRCWKREDKVDMLSLYTAAPVQFYFSFVCLFVFNLLKVLLLLVKVTEPFFLYIICHPPPPRKVFFLQICYLNQLPLMPQCLSENPMKKKHFEVGNFEVS